MPKMKIEDEIQQGSFKNEYLKAHLNILFSASWMNQLVNQTLKPHNISWQQYNILRILKGKKNKPATVKELTEKMIDRMSNASRLVEKLSKKGLIERVINESDRRRANVSITKKGLSLLSEISEVMEQKMTESMMGLNVEEVKTLNRLLDKMRD